MTTSPWCSARNSTSAYSRAVSATAWPPREICRAAGVNHNVAHRQHVARPARAAPDERAQPREQFRQVERLDHIIVRARVQAAHPVFGLVARRQHEDGRFFGFAQTPQNSQPSTLGSITSSTTAS